ncbi:molybdenum cofactor guanylyltransferase [Microbacterium sp. MPKO10]|uniref:molybdenum cofactor guanylyltransferase n=1 Tax=Microbacterium sp. MPKO10 TaxID=2989818 RepID=UPI00223555C1|nr:NTP transferase domain-containing protein [Microbacterium sp. MPKO10]MCW4458696.1 NTP transferase domain-containing protein [Microbacterium sp. MPKO10]
MTAAAHRPRHAAIVLAGGRGSRLGGADKASVEIDGRMLLDHVLAAVEGCAPIIVVGPPHLAGPQSSQLPRTSPSHAVSRRETAPQTPPSDAAPQADRAGPRGSRSQVDPALQPVLSPSPQRNDIVLVREDPPFTGPVAAIAAALAALADTDPNQAARTRATAKGRTPHAPSSGSELSRETWLLACDLPRAADIVAQLSMPIPHDADALALVDGEGKVQWLAGRYRTAALQAAVAALPDTAGASMRQLLASIRLRLVPDETGASVDLDTWAAINHYRSNEEDHHG